MKDAVYQPILTQYVIYHTAQLIEYSGNLNVFPLHDFLVRKDFYLHIYYMPMPIHYINIQQVIDTFLF